MSTGDSINNYVSWESSTNKSIRWNLVSAFAGLFPIILCWFAKICLLHFDFDTAWNKYFSDLILLYFSIGISTSIIIDFSFLEETDTNGYQKLFIYTPPILLLLFGFFAVISTIIDKQVGEFNATLQYFAFGISIVHGFVVKRKMFSLEQ